jgi:transposase
MRSGKCKQLESQLLIGNMAIKLGIANAARLAGISSQRAYYYKQKVSNPNFRRYLHGQTPKRCKPVWLKKEIVRIVEETSTNNPNATLMNFKNEVAKQFNLSVSISFIARTIIKAGYRYKKNSNQRHYKFSQANQLYYREYIERIRTYNRRTIYYLDESHYSSKALTLDYGWTLKGTRRVQIEKKLPSKSYSVTLITSINEELEPTFVSSLREGSNNCQNFGAVLIEAIEQEYILPNSILVLDNASIHKAAAMLEYIRPLLQAYNIKMIYLPTYSPELNPCEKCFNQSKMYVRKNRKEDETVDEFKDLIYESFEQITRENMRAYYDHCIDCHFSVRFTI